MEDILGSNIEFYDKEFTDVSICKQEATNKEFDGCSFISCDFSESSFINCKFSDCRFIKCNLSAMNVKNSKFSDVVFQESKVLGVDWTKAYWRGLALGSPLCFKECLVSSSSFYGLIQPGIIFDECRAHDVDFREADLTRSIFCKTDLTNSLFSNTNLTGADFYGASNYDININTNTIKNARFCRYEAVSLLKSLDVKLVE